jgi:hypothetical protein
MCDKCAELDAKIEHLRGLAGRIRDEATLKGIYDLIADAVAHKAALHLDPDESTRH